MKRFAVVSASVLVLAACGGGGGGGNSGSASAQISHVWTSFFSAKTPASQKAAMLQDGSKFAKTIKTLSKNPLAQKLSAKVSKVNVYTTLGSSMAKQATVVYSIYLGSTAVLKNQKGVALKQNGKWVVGYASLCKLLAFEGPAPAACAS